MEHSPRFFNGGQQSQKKSDIKRELSDLWEQNPDGQSFIKEAAKAGYQIAKADDGRPWRVITPAGESLDLVRQLESVKTKDVRERLQPIRDEMKTVAEALEIVRGAVQKEKDQARPEPQPSDKGRELSDSQGMAAAMLKRKEEERQVAEYKKNQWKDLSPDAYLKYKQDKETQLYKKNQWRDLAFGLN